MENFKYVILTQSLKAIKFSDNSLYEDVIEYSSVTCSHVKQPSVAG